MLSIFEVFSVLCFNSVAICGWQLSFGRYQADEQAWVDTIKSVGSGGTVRISTMDWLGQSQYLKATVYWSSLSLAVSEVTFSATAYILEIF